MNYSEDDVSLPAELCLMEVDLCGSRATGHHWQPLLACEGILTYQQAPPSERVSDTHSWLAHVHISSLESMHKDT